MAKRLVIAAILAAAGIFCWSIAYAVGLCGAPHVHTGTVAAVLDAEEDDVFLRSGSSLGYGHIVEIPADKQNGPIVTEWGDGSREKTTLEDGLYDGPSLLYDKAGVLRLLETNRDGTLDGVTRVWDSHGILRVEGEYWNDSPGHSVRVGTWKFWDRHGQPTTLNPDPAARNCPPPKARPRP